MAVKLLFKIATRNRPFLLFKSLDFLIKNLSNKIDYNIIISIDIDDKTMCNSNAINTLNEYSNKHNVSYFIGESSSKVDALNRDIGKSNLNWDTLINFTEYTEFVIKGFDDEIRKIETLGYGKLKNNVFSINSINNNGKEIKKLYLMGKNCYNKNGYLYNPKFKSNLYKEELKNNCSKMLESFRLAPLFNYRHSDWNYYMTDDTTKNKMNHWKQDLHTLENILNEG